MYSEDRKHGRSEGKQLCAHRQSKQQQPNRKQSRSACTLSVVDLFCLCLKHLVQICLRGVIPDKMGKYLTLFQPESQNP